MLQIITICGILYYFSRMDICAWDFVETSLFAHVPAARRFQEYTTDKKNLSRRAVPTTELV